MAGVHPSAVVDPRADLAPDVTVGPFAIVEAGAALGPGCVLHAHAVVRGATTLGERCVVHPFAVVGGEPQSRKHDGGPARLICGQDNVFREHVTVHGGTGGGDTRVGDGNLFMVGSHVAHDVVVGSGCVVSNGVQLAGHVVLGDWVTLGGLAGVAQFVHVGESAFVAAMSACEARVPPFVVVQGNRARVRAVNTVGLRRRAVPEQSIRALRHAVGRLWLGRLTLVEAIASLATDPDPYVQRLLEALR